MLDSTSIAESVAQLVGLLGGRVEKMIMPDGDPKGNGGTHDLFEERSTIWCEALKAGKPYP